MAHPYLLKPSAKRARRTQVRRRPLQTTQLSAVRPRQSVRIPRNLPGSVVGATVGFPRTLKFKHRYSDVVNISGTGNPGYRFIANGLYDPNQSGTGHQPLYFDQLAAIYNHYCVIGSKIKVQIVPQGSTVEDPYRVVLWLNDDTSTVPNMEGITEQNEAVQAICGGANPNTITLENSWSLKKRFMGRPAESRFIGTSAANPSETTVFQLNIEALDGGVSNIAVHAVVEIEFIAIWTELKDIAAS